MHNLRQYRLFPGTLAFLAGALFLVSGTVAFAQTSRVYFAGYIGLNTIPNQSYRTRNQDGDLSFDNAPSFGGALGLRLTQQLRIETELSYKKHDANTLTIGGTDKVGGSLETWAAMLNGYYDFDIDWRGLQPFVTAGVGIMQHTADILMPSGTHTYKSGESYNIGWQAGGGLKYRVDEKMALTGSYRYSGSTEIGFDQVDLDYSNHEIRFGVQYDFLP